MQKGGGAAPLKTAKEPGEKHRLEPYFNFGGRKFFNHMNPEEPNFESKPSNVEQKEKPTFLYHGSNVPNIEVIEPRKRYTPGGAQNVPERIYAGDLPAFAAAHSFPWGSDEGFDLSIENGKVIFKVPNKFKDRLAQKVYLYKISSDKFAWTSGEGTGHTYHSQEATRPDEIQEFNSVQEAIEHFGGEVIYIEDHDN